MGLVCDFCGDGVSFEHKMSCERCFNMILHLLTKLKDEKKDKRTYKKKKTAKIKKKRKVVKEKIKVLPKFTKKTKITAEEDGHDKTDREALFEDVVSKKVNTTKIATKCNACEFSFLDGQTKKISCINGKDPATCGK